jgi:hypothetical protein
MRRALILATVAAAFVGLLAYAERAPRASRSVAPAAAPSASGSQAAGFDGARAWEHLKQVVAIGPRPAGSAGLRRTREYIAKQIEAMGLKVEEQRFTPDTPQGRVEMVNLIVRLPGKRPEKILFTGHYDTKPFKDRVFVGANDAGSSSAFLIELARVLKDRPREFTHELVWFDGEEAFCLNWDDCGKPGNPDNTYGSRHYVRAAQQAKAIPSLKAMILVDMIGDRDLVLKREERSTAWLKDIIWGTAKRLGHSGVFSDIETPIEDDHIPFLDAGVAAVDLIDLEYPPWHEASDTLDKVSQRSLQIVGDVLVAAVPEIEKRLSQR